MIKDILVDVKQFGFLDDFLKSPYTKISEKEFSKALYAFITFTVIAMIYSFSYFFDKKFNAFSVLNIICYILGFYSLFFSGYFFYNYHKSKNYSFFEVYELLVQSNDGNGRFVLLEYMSAMRTVANLIISNKVLNNKFYSKIDVIEQILNQFNPIIGLGYEVFANEADLYVKNHLLDDMNKTLPIIAKIQEYLISDKNDEKNFMMFIDELMDKRSYG